VHLHSQPSDRRSKQRRLLFLGALSLVALSSWAGARLWSATADTSSPSNEQPQLAVKTMSRDLPEVTTLYQREGSPYHARLFADEEAVVLVTQTGFTTFRAGEAPEEHAVSLGPVTIRRGGTLVFWRAGSLREISLTGEGERSLAPLPHPPRYLLASEGHLAWIQMEPETGTSLQTLSAGSVREVHDSDDNVGAAVMRGAVVYWVLHSRDGSWKIGRVGLDGEHQLTRAHEGRPPAMLAWGPDGVYFYDGPKRGVRKLSFDLEREDAISANVVCSPLAVSTRIICAQVGGLFELPALGGTPRFLATERAGPITATAVTDDRAFWVAENGNERLVVRSAALAGL
jgi:hypothetical protein